MSKTHTFKPLGQRQSEPELNHLDNYNHNCNHNHEPSHIHSSNSPHHAQAYSNEHATHDHGSLCGHVHATGKRLKWAFWATLIILVVEVIGGSLANSLALLSDAGHVLTDVAALGLAWFASVQALKSPTLTKTFGYHRTGIFAALANALTLIIIAFIILYEAIHRFQNPEQVQPMIMYLSASVGIIVNLAIAFGFRGSEDNLNVRSALLHVLGDAAASAGVIIGGIIIQITQWYVVDPIISVLIAFMIAWGAWKIVRETLHILMEGTPKDFQYDRLAAFIRTLPGARNLHDLHVWAVTPERIALTCHLIVDESCSLARGTEIIQQVKDFIAQEFHIAHATIEIESKPCNASSLLCQETLWEVTTSH